MDEKRRGDSSDLLPPGKVVVLSLVGFLGISVQVPLLVGIDLLAEGDVLGVILVLAGLVTLALIIFWFRWLSRLRSALLDRAP